MARKFLYIVATLIVLVIIGAFSYRLFPDQIMRAAFAPTLEHLTTLGEEIDAMRDTLFLEPFALHAQFLASRGRVSAEAVGEPKQARAWLDRLAAEDAG